MLVLWGDDFSLVSNTSYDILDMIIESLYSKFEADGLSNRYTLSYSSMTDYFESVFNDGKDIDWMQEKGDFWAYNEVDAIWTGYFSTNP